VEAFPLASPMIEMIDALWWRGGSLKISNNSYARQT
jgi:hypothetical protein